MESLVSLSTQAHVAGSVVAGVQLGRAAGLGNTPRGSGGTGGHRPQALALVALARVFCV